MTIDPRDVERAAKVAVVMMDGCDPEADTATPGHKAWMNFRDEAPDWHAAIVAQGYLPPDDSEEFVKRLALALLAQADAAVAACCSPAEWEDMGREKAARIIREAVERHNARKGKE